MNPAVPQSDIDEAMAEDPAAFVDPNGGSSDSMTLAIGHRSDEGGGTAVLDLLREVRPPFSPDAVVTEFAETMKIYGITKVVGDRFGGEFVREPFRNAGISYEPSEYSKSDIYRDLLPGINSCRVKLLDHKGLASQLVQLERRTGWGTGKDSIDHPPGAHDDVANAVAGVLTSIIRKPNILGIWRRL